MKTFTKIFGGIAFAWAILSFFILPVLDGSYGVGSMSRSAHHLARDLRSVLPEHSAIPTASVNLPAQQVSNLAALLDRAGEASQGVLKLQNFEILVSSAAIIIMSICMFVICKRDPNTARSLLSREFYNAAILGDMNKVRQMFAADPSLVHSKIEYELTALHGVAAEEQFEMAEFLLDRGADPVAKNDGGITPLHLAVYPEMIELFVRRGADINVRANDGRTPLLVQASEAEGFETIETLLKLGADAMARDSRGKRALDIARSREEADKIELLMKYDAA